MVNSGVACIQYVKELQMQMKDLKPIVLIIKKLLQNYNLNHTYTGGLNSYSLVLMVATFLRLFPGVDSMSKNLIEIFKFYGKYLDYRTTYIQDLQLLKSHLGCEFDSMMIMDPLNSTNNVAKGAYRIADILKIFRHSYDVLQESLNLFKHDSQPINIMKLLLEGENISFEL